MQEGQTATMLPPTEIQDNTFFSRKERLMTQTPSAGVKGDTGK